MIKVPRSTVHGKLSKQPSNWGGSKDELIWDQIIRERNLAVHTYSQELAETVYGEIPKLKCAFIELKKNLQKVYPFD
jgi:uncharacterized protein with HEPN domain